MRKAISIVLCLCLMSPAELLAGGRSYSGSSSGSSSSSSSGGRSYSGSSSSGGSSGGRAYSAPSGGSSGGRSSSTPAPAGRSYSGSSSTPAPAGRSYSGSSSTPAPSGAKNGASPPSGAPAGRSYSGSSSVTTPPSPAELPKTGFKPIQSHGWDTKGAEVQRQVESQKKFIASQPKETYKTPTGETKTINSTDRTVTGIRENLDSTKYASRPNRHYTVYQTYYSRTTPIVMYSDPYDHYFYWWLLDRSLDQRALWVYNHYDSIDRARINDMYIKDAQLEARVRQLEADKARRDPTWTPTGLDPDLQYHDSYVNAVYNPQHEVYHADWGSFWKGLGILVYILVFLVLFALAIMIEESRPITATISCLMVAAGTIWLFGWIIGLIVTVVFSGCFVFFCVDFGSID